MSHACPLHCHARKKRIVIGKNLKKNTGWASFPRAPGQSTRCLTWKIRSSTPPTSFFLQLTQTHGSLSVLQDRESTHCCESRTSLQTQRWRRFVCIARTKRVDACQGRLMLARHILVNVLLESVELAEKPNQKTIRFFTVLHPRHHPRVCFWGVFLPWAICALLCFSVYYPAPPFASLAAFFGFSMHV